MTDLHNLPSASSTARDLPVHDYRTVTCDHELVGLHRDAYAAFGWVEDARTPGLPAGELRLQRSRSLPSGRIIQELQQQCETALAAISRLRRSPARVAWLVTALFVVVGSTLLAGSVFAISPTVSWSSVALGAAGLVAWAVGGGMHMRVRQARAATIRPQLEARYAEVHHTAERAQELLG